ncbi:hypothetical protein J7T55_005726 [Diaporthe amygdali]|uniref:uncharacterized protein n=1 Tax=Phomopsis amygdali TaxID=1214568 RepID=UPI0022FF0D9F|nr:uncharacterized protein J7T55_005726 [Diaporthe amygdali]KAJ0124388.1 hypothetical protein J7T55_005726 [Diaporthe amygdali]
MEEGWDYPALLTEGARRYPNSPYIITYSGYEHVVFPSSSFDEVKRLSVSRASTIAWFNQAFWQGWAFYGTDNHARYHTVAIGLAKAAFEAVLGPQGTSKDWTTVSLWRTVQSIVTLMNASDLLRPELGIDPRWLKATHRVDRAMMVGVVGSHYTPRNLRPLVAPIFFLPAKVVDWYMQSLVRPTVERELKAYEAKEAKEADGGHNSSDDIISTIVQDGGVGTGTECHRSIKEKFPLTEWLWAGASSRHSHMRRQISLCKVTNGDAAKPGHEEMHQFAMPGPNNTIWGNGTQACPGRAFASITIKVVLAHLLTHYDIRLLPGGANEPKRYSMPNGSNSPDIMSKIMIRDRFR